MAAIAGRCLCRWAGYRSRWRDHPKLDAEETALVSIRISMGGWLLVSGHADDHGPDSEPHWGQYDLSPCRLHPDRWVPQRDRTHRDGAAGVRRNGMVYPGTAITAGRDIRLRPGCPYPPSGIAA